MLLSKALRMQ
jgi:hypothetical protein